MQKIVQFLGLSISSGQPEGGLSLSANYAREYLLALNKTGVAIRDQGDVFSSYGNYIQVHCEEELDFVDWASYKKAYQIIKQLLQKPFPLLNWGGDHSIGLATVGAFCSQFPEGFVLWIDAHADLNLPASSPSGNLHGMPLALLLNLSGVAQTHLPWLTHALNPEKLIYIGLRDLDPFETYIIQKLGIKCFTVRDIRRDGMAKVADRIFDICQHEKLHISFDIDSVSPEFAPSTGVPVKQGLTPQDLKILAEATSEHQAISSIDVVEINPTIGSVEDVHATFITALDFLKTIFCSQNVEKRRSSYDINDRTRQAFDSTSMEGRS